MPASTVNHYVLCQVVVTMHSTNFYADLHREAEYLQKHDLSSWPLDKDLAKYVLALEDKVDCLCRYLQVNVEKDCRGRWIVIPQRGDPYGG